MAGVGIYLNTKTSKVIRAGAPPNAPEGSEWHKITDEPNASLLQVRDIIRRENLALDPDVVAW